MFVLCMGKGYVSMYGKPPHARTRTQRAGPMYIYMCVCVCVYVCMYVSIYIYIFIHTYIV